MYLTTRKVIIGGLALVLMGGTKARAVPLRTGSIEPLAGQKLVCTVLNVQTKSLGMGAEIVDRFGNNATDFAFTDYDDSGAIVTTLRVESSSPNARYCRIVVTNGKKHDVSGSLRACTFDDSACGAALVAK
jgi:hypothetical protein